MPPITLSKHRKPSTTLNYFWKKEMDFLIFTASNTAFQQVVKVNVAFLVITELFEMICSRDEEKNQRL